MKSKVIAGEKESIVHIMGCPNCYGERAIKIRTCPVCKVNLPDEGYLIGRMWKKKQGKMHLHISGCTICKSGIKKNK